MRGFHRRETILFLILGNVPGLSSDNLDERQKWVGKSEAITAVQAGEGGDVQLVSELLEKVEI